MWIARRVYKSRETWWKGSRENADLVFPVYLLSLVFLLAFILTNKVFSPQYLLWLGPLLLVLAAVNRKFEKTGWLFLAATVLTQAIFPHLYVFLQQFKPPMIVLLNLRNGLLVWIGFLLVKNLPQWWEAIRGDSGFAGQLPVHMDHSLNDGEGAQGRNDKNAGQHHERTDVGNTGEP